MPKSAVADVLHATYTNHRIQARQSRSTAGTELAKPIEFESGAPRRDVAMAQAQIAFQYDNASMASGALRLMSDLEPSLAWDAPALAVLGRLYDLQGNQGKARELYQKSVSLDLSQVEAAVNLGAILFAEGNSNAAIDWWRLALRAQPLLEAARLNIARALVSNGKIDEARKELLTLMDFSPNHPLALKELNSLRPSRPR